jgi:hypothetical protein
VFGLYTGDLGTPVSDGRLVVVHDLSFKCVIRVVIIGHDGGTDDDT